VPIDGGESVDITHEGKYDARRTIQRLGLSRQTISAMENGKREMLWSTVSVVLLEEQRNQTTDVGNGHYG